MDKKIKTKIMKTTEEVKKEVLNYLKKSSNHLFLIDEKEEHKVLVSGDFCIRITGNYVSITDINTTIKYYGNDSKNVIKNSLFLIPRYYNKSIKTIPNYKAARIKYNGILEAIKGKTDKSEIIKIAKSLL